MYLNNNIFSEFIKHQTCYKLTINILSNKNCSNYYNYYINKNI